ncbi:MAG: DUF1638 domain-containing protein [Pseudomonadota bacterium]
MELDDSTLTETGFETPGGGRVLLIACGALAREVLALKALNGWGHLDLACLPALLHNRPEQISERVQTKIHDAKQEGYRRIFVLYADCGTGGMLDKVCAEEDVERIYGPHCYSFFSGNQSFANISDDGTDITSFYLTDFLARQFDALVWRGMGLDRYPDLRDMYFAHYEKVVYLAQTDDPALDAKAQEAASRLGLAYERRFTGYGDLATTLATVASG